MRVLVLTDHQTHADGESIYPLLLSMDRHEACKDVFVATRGRSENRPFFRDDGGTRIVGRRIDADFCYQDDGRWFLTEAVELDALDFDAVFLRVDRPVSDSLLDSFASRFPKQKIINDPKGIQETGEKGFLLRFPELCPPMQVCTSLQDVAEFSSRFPIVLKPLRSYGGRGLVRVDGQTAWDEGRQTTLDDLWPMLEERLREEGQMLAVKFLPTIDRGDKRIVVVNKQVLGATLRIPSPGSWIANLSKGGTSHFADIDPEEQRIADLISPPLLERGVVIFGFDTLIGDDGKRVLSEINTLNVGCLTEAEEHSGEPVVSRAADLILNHLLCG